MQTLEQLLTLMTPLLLALAGLVAARFEARIKRLTHIEMESYHRDALHLALETGVRLAIAKVLRDGVSVDARISDIKEQAVAYARKSVPDAIEYLSAQFETLLDLAESKIEGERPALYDDALLLGEADQGQLAL